VGQAGERGDEFRFHHAHTQLQVGPGKESEMLIGKKGDGAGEGGSVPFKHTSTTPRITFSI
jgi:hypothetical protein